MKQAAPFFRAGRPRQWLAGVVALLVLTLTPLGWIQWQQFKLMEEMAEEQVDAIMWHAYQLERELSRLGEQVERAAHEDSPVTAEGLTERYEVFLSRIDLLHSMPRRDLFQGSQVFSDTMAEVQQFVQVTEPLFQAPQALLDNPTHLDALLKSIYQLLPQLSALTREANRANALLIDERNAQLQQQSVLVISLAALQSLALLVFVVVVVRYMLRQQAQYARLQKLSSELTDARDQAEAAYQGKSAFLANMSHEIRTPFQGLLGMLNLLDEPGLSAQQRDYLKTARDSALHLLGVLNDVLDLSTMESGTLKLSVAPIHLRGVVHEVESLMQVAASDKSLQLNIAIASDLPTWFMADATRLRQIMFNLINNAIKFTPHGSVMVEVARPPDGEPGIRIHVRDTGVGMDKATLEQLFTRFYQADNSLRRRVGGTGLGLDISRNLARLMGGDIQVSSAPGQGSVFTVTLPLPATEAPALEPVQTARLPENRRLSVLVAEDHPINLKYISILLENMGHDGVFCQNGHEALQLLQRQAFDVVLLDYHMPELDGLATTEAIRMLKRPACDVKVILITADVVNDTRKKALDAGVDEFVSKPLQAQDLRRSLERCGLSQHPGTEDVRWAQGAGPQLAPQSSPFPLSTYEAPLRLPEAVQGAIEVIDTAAYSDIFSMMPENSMDKLLETLFEPPEGTVCVLLEALQDGTCNREAIGFHAHKLKGTAMLLGFTAITKTAARIEHLACDTHDVLPTELCEQLLQDMAATQKALRHFVEMEQANR